MGEVVDKLMKLAMKEYKESGRDRLGSLSISDVAGCMRRSKYKLMSTPPSDVPPSYVSVKDGTMYHEAMQRDLAKIYKGRFTDEEATVVIELRPGLSLKGHIDGRLSVGADKEPHLLEIKTYSPYSWRNRLPLSEDYKDQATLYMGGLGLKKAIFLLRNRSSYEVDEVLFEFDQDRFDRLLVRATAVHDTPLEDMPQIPVEKGDKLNWKCVYCNYLRKCWGKNRIEPSRTDAGGNHRAWKLK